jgi:hypothetical protein
MRCTHEDRLDKWRGLKQITGISVDICVLTSCRHNTWRGLKQISSR